MVNQLSRITLAIFCFLFTSAAFSQMSNQQGVHFGNEWIKYDNTYYKFEIDKDGIYRIDASTLASLGMNLSETSSLRLMHNGQEESLYFSSDNNVLGANDYLEFVGTKTTIELDTFLYENWEQDLLNPYYGLFTDVSAYYFTIDANGQAPLRYAHVSGNFDENGLPVVTTFRHKEILNFPTSFYKPQVGQLKYSHFQGSEGYTSGLRAQYSTNVGLKGIAANGSNAEMEFRMSSNNEWPIIKEIKWNNEVIGIDTSGSGRTAIFRTSLPQSAIKADNKADFKNLVSTGLFGIANINITYDRTFDFSGIPYIKADLNNSSKSIISLVVDAASPAYVLDVHNHKAYTINTSGKIAVEAGANIAITNSINKLTSGKVKKFKALSQTNTDYLFITSEKLYPEVRNANPIDEYAAYRSSLAGGGFKTSILTVEDIYDQFGYGIPNHNWSFKNLSAYLKDAWPSLQYVLIVGKAREYEYVRTKEQLANPLNQTFYVPTFGTAPSDVLLFSPDKYVNTYFSIGRIAASNLADVAIYLAKIKTHDKAIDAPQEEDKLWLKNIVHLGGGASAGEQSSIKWFLDQMTDTISSGQFGGQVSSFYKTSTTDIQIANVEGVKKNINNGAAIITFFGHASVNAFEFNLDNPESYSNNGRYPFIFSLGCYSGNIHTPSMGISESFIFSPNRGAIAFIASGGTAYLSTQGVYGTKFYSKLTSTFYGKRLGDMFKEFGDQEKEVFNPGEYTLYQQLTFHGDPAVKIHGFEKPDFVTDYSSVKINPVDILETATEINLTANIINYGRNGEYKLPLKAFYVSASGDTSTYTYKSINISKSLDSISMSIPLKNIKEGVYKLIVELDYDNKIDENNEINNILTDGLNLGYEFSVMSDQVKPQYPFHNSIVNNLREVRLIGASTNSSAVNSTYIVQIDTTNKFNSPGFKEYFVSSVSNFLDFTPEYNWKDHTTYYWRLANRNMNLDHLVWQESNFTYIEENINGWVKQHHYQLEDNTFENIIYSENEALRYGQRSRTIQIKSEVYSGETPFTHIDGQKWGALTPNNGNIDAINVAVFTGLGPYVNKNGNQFGSTSTPDNIVFIFNPKNQNDRKGINDLLNSLPENSEVFIYFYYASPTPNYGVSEWENDKNELGYTLYETLNKVGAEYFNLMADSGPLPYIYNYNTSKGKIKEVIGENIASGVTLSSSFYPLYPSGTSSYRNIGPSNNFEYLEVDYDLIGNDKITYDISYKLDNTNEEIIWKTGLDQFLLDLTDLNKITGSKTIHVKFNTEDATERTLPNISSVLVSYTPAADLISQALISIDTIFQGEALELFCQLFNISQDTFQEIEGTLTIIDESNKAVNIALKFNNNLPFETNKIKVVSKIVSTHGIHTIIFKINSPNPIIKELNLNNNTLTKRIFVKKDQVNPKLEVFFDGEFIYDGQIISSTPSIMLEAKDENIYNLIDNPALFDVTLINKTKNETFIINPVDDSRIKFIQGNVENKNQAKLYFTPELENGEYMLTANVRDKSGNIAGNEAYEINFEVTGEFGLKSLSNYPNPFSKTTQFSIEIIGKAPTSYSIQLFTTTGNLVREYSEKDMGPLHVGKNTISTPWDGTDQNNQQLANGVYILKFIPKDADFQKQRKDNGLISKLMIIR